MRHAAHRLYLGLIEIIALSWWTGWFLSRNTRRATRTAASHWRATVVSGLAVLVLAGTFTPGTPKPAGTKQPVYATAQYVPDMMKHRVPNPPDPPKVPKPSDVVVPPEYRTAVEPNENPPRQSLSQVNAEKAKEAKPKPKPKPWKPKRAYDSIHAWAIPKNAPVVAGYTDGAYYWSSQNWTSFPKSKKITITVFAGDQHANTVDIEPGCATAGQARAWLAKRIAAGHTVNIVYVMRSQQAYVEWVLRGLDYYLWVADWTWQAHRVPRADMVQWSSSQTLDISTIYSQKLYSSLRR